MWDFLKPADIAQARQQVQLRRDETLRRQAAERQTLDVDQAEIDTLERLIAAFSDKIKAKTAPAASAAPPAPVKPPEPPAPAERIEHPAAVKRHDHAVPAAGKPHEHAVLHNHRADKPPHKPRHLERPDHPRTNFDTFSRAMAKAERGW